MNLGPVIPRSHQSGQEELNNLLSIDMDAHLNNVAANTYQSPSHFPVELVRSALNRGANQIKVLIKRDRMQIQDNGSGINSLQMKALSNIIDLNQPVEVREQSIPNFQSDQGIDLLALFAPSPEKILIENVSSSGKNCLHSEKGKSLKTGSCEIKSGTRITLFRTNGNIKLETKLLQEYCGGVQKEISLNGLIISKKKLLPNSLVSLKLKASNGFGNGIVGIPYKRNICCIWLLDQGIPWIHTTLPQWNGFIFEAAVEYDGKVSSPLLNWISNSVFRLYEQLALQYPDSSTEDKARIEELIFRHNRLTNNSYLVNQFSPFRLVNSSVCLSLDQIYKKTASDTLFAIPMTDHSGQYNTQGKTVLFLHKHQADFLVNHHRMPIRFLSPVFQNKSRILRISSSLIKIFRKAVSRIHLGPRKSAATNTLTNEEIIFIQTAAYYLSNEYLPQCGFHTDITVEPMMINSRGFFPVETVKKKKVLQLFIRRKHPLIRKAIRAIQLHSNNIELIAPLLIQKEL